MLRHRLALAGLVAVLAFLSVYPMGMLLYGSFHSTPPGVTGAFNFDGYRALMSASNVRMFANTFGISFVKSVLSMGLAISLAWIVARTDTPARGMLEVLITLPFFIPPVLTATAWSLLGNPQAGTLNLAWEWLTGSSHPVFDVYSYGGVVWHLMQYATPFLFLFVVEAFRAMDPALEEASRMSGASRTQTFLHVTLVLMLPVITGMFILSFIRGTEAFESPIFFGTPAGIQMLSTRIYDLLTQNAQPDYQSATALGFASMAVLFLLVVWQWRVLRGRSFHTVTGRGYAPNVMRLGALRWVTFAMCLAFFCVTVILPVGQLLLSSFFKYPGFYRLNMLTLDHYRAIWHSDDFWLALRNTMELGLAGASATMVLGAIIAYVTVRTRWPGRRLVDVLAWLPWMMPGIVLAVGFLWGFVMLPRAIPIYGTLAALLLAYIALGSPVAVRVMAGSYAQLSFDLEECSRVHGASWWQTLWRILVALAWQSFAIGWVLIFFGIMRELSASILLYAPGTKVLSVVMLQMWENGNGGDVSVIGLLMVVLVVVFRCVQLRLINKRITTL